MPVFAMLYFQLKNQSYFKKLKGLAPHVNRVFRVLEVGISG